jgi:hypothetical protein
MGLTLVLVKYFPVFCTGLWRHSIQGKEPGQAAYNNDGIKWRADPEEIPCAYRYWS